MFMRKYTPLLFAFILQTTAVSVAAAATTPLPQTGQTACWDSLGVQIDCAGTGQDGDLRKGTAWPETRFVDNGDGTMTDKLTDLTWLKNAGCSGPLTWINAVGWSNTLASGACGLTDHSAAGDWRLPNINELESLMNMQQTAPAWLASQGFVNPPDTYIWSSTTYAKIPNYSMYLGSPGFANVVYHGVKGSTYAAIPVKGGISGTMVHLNVTKVGHGSGSVAADTGTLQWSNNVGQGHYLKGATVTLSAAAESGSVFTGWSGGCEGTGTCRVTMDAIQDVTATFGVPGVCGSAVDQQSVEMPTANLCGSGEATVPTLSGGYWNWTCRGFDNAESAACRAVSEWPLTVNVTGPGTVSAPDMVCRDAVCSHGYAAGTELSLSATADQNYTFVGWSGACSGTGNCQVVMNQAVSVGAQFADRTPPVLTVPSFDAVLNTSGADLVQKALAAGASAVDAVDGPVAITVQDTPVLSKVGLQQVTFSAADRSGNSTSVTVPVYVVYGCGETYLNDLPVSYLTPQDQIPVFAAGATVPVKLHLCDANGADVTAAVARIYLQPYCGEVPAADPLSIPQIAADSANHFRVEAKSYIYNLSTQGKGTGSYRVHAVLDDSTMRTIPFAVKP